jgi:hypothetical protein
MSDDAHVFQASRLTRGDARRIRELIEKYQAGG